MAHDARTRPTLYGLMAEFDTPAALVAAAERARLAGYRKMDAYSPIPIEELDEALGLQRTRLPMLVLLGGIARRPRRLRPRVLGVRSIAYPMNVGGRPFHSWPQFIPVTFETTVLGAALTAFVGMWALNGLPQPYHPVFNVPEFARASTRSLLPRASRRPIRGSIATATRQFLEGLHPVGVSDVAP